MKVIKIVFQKLRFFIQEQQCVFKKKNAKIQVKNDDREEFK